MPLRGTSILRLRRAPFGFIGRRPSGQARRLFGWSQTRESLCRTPVSKGLLVWHVIPCFRFSSYAFTRIRVRQRAYGFASDDDTEQRFAQLSYWSLRRRGASSRHIYPAPSARPFSKGLLISYALLYFHFSACSLPRIRARQRSLDFASVDDME